LQNSKVNHFNKMPNSIHVLLIEDELKLLMAMHQGLTDRQIKADTASDGKIGLELALKNQYAVIVTDIILPHFSGIEILRQLRSSGNKTPVILLTALNDLEDKTEGFEAGADDYLTKPFDFQELYLRIKALARRPIETYKNSNTLKFLDVEMNLDTKEVSRLNKKIMLTPREFDLLEYFLRNPERVISKVEIAEKVWKLDFDTGTNVVEVYVNFLRKKLESDFESKLIHTQFKTGYIFGHY
jgi:two-component system, OmpR family, copper resistance phosphate regulon response regulator CusR